MFTYETNCMAIVNHNQSVVFICQVANTFQVADDTVHGEYTVSSNQFDSCACLVSLFQFSFEVFHVVVFVSESLSFAETYTIDDGSMVEFVTDNSVVSCQDCFEQTAVCIEAGGVQNGVICAQEVGDLLLELFMNILCTADETYGSNTVTSFIVCSLSSVNQSLVVAKAKVVVSTHVDNGSAVFQLYFCALWRYERELTFEKASCFDIFDFFSVNAQNVIFTCHF